MFFELCRYPSPPKTVVSRRRIPRFLLKIKKVFYINLLYFPFPDTKSPLHHGKVIFHEKDKLHPVDFHLVDRGMNIFDLHNIFPEYFMVSIPLFYFLLLC